jgi:predicted nucleic acid-binding protein
MAIILDADVVIRGEKGLFDLGGWLNSLSSEPLELAAITVAELWHGVERADASHRSRRETYLRTFLNAISIIPYTEETAYHHARILAQLESTGKMIGPYDLIVAATTLERDGQLATFNKRHFANVQGLKILEPK